MIGAAAVIERTRGAERNERRLNAGNCWAIFFHPFSGEIQRDSQRGGMKEKKKKTLSAFFFCFCFFSALLLGCNIFALAHSSCSAQRKIHFHFIFSDWLGCCCCCRIKNSSVAFLTPNDPQVANTRARELSKTSENKKERKKNHNWKIQLGKKKSVCEFFFLILFVHSVLSARVK